MGLCLHRKDSSMAMAMFYSRKMGSFSQTKKKNKRRCLVAMIWTKYLSWSPGVFILLLLCGGILLSLGRQWKITSSDQQVWSLWCVLPGPPAPPSTWNSQQLLCFWEWHSSQKLCQVEGVVKWKLEYIQLWKLEYIHCFSSVFMFFCRPEFSCF